MQISSCNKSPWSPSAHQANGIHAAYRRLLFHHGADVRDQIGARRLAERCSGSRQNANKMLEIKRGDRLKYDIFIIR